MKVDTYLFICLFSSRYQVKARTRFEGRYGPETDKELRALLNSGHQQDRLLGVSEIGVFPWFKALLCLLSRLLAIFPRGPNSPYHFAVLTWRLLVPVKYIEMSEYDGSIPLDNLSHHLQSVLPSHGTDPVVAAAAVHAIGLLLSVRRRGHAGYNAFFEFEAGRALEWLAS